MAEKAAKGSARKPKPVMAKTSLNNPYNLAWNTVGGDDMQFILKVLIDRFEQLGLKKIQIAKKRSKRKKGKTHKESDKEKSDGQSCEVEECDQEQDKQAKSGWTLGDLRRQLVIGINEVTRALEKNELNLVLVCKSAKPDMITKHLIELSASRETPACQLPRLSENIGPVLGLRSVLAIGFKKNSDVFTEEVKLVLPKLPPLYVPWLNSRCQEQTLPLEEEAGNEEMSSEVTTSHKRKRSKSDAESKEVGNIKLEALRIKRIVPNPNKIRKVKKKAVKK
ncbi:hypothetical protein GDO86_011845 [Hymenochirus boettgeri]|uniref:Ribosomal protein eL8/eL30/eS12/Gadd45 domain-containing protein n=1 Tax=Hymenochirus boettgeri TaxID=247094 RepID=A0A8T2JDB3_9PIPI|nr:hypothetical protein GDO86_011845 [Hymenochirus boettgeri]